MSGSVARGLRQRQRDRRRRVLDDLSLVRGERNVVPPDAIKAAAADNDVSARTVRRWVRDEWGVGAIGAHEHQPPRVCWLAYADMIEDRDAEGRLSDEAVAECARRTGYSVRQVRRWVVNGGPPLSRHEPKVTADVIEALAERYGHLGLAAEDLGINRRTLNDWVLREVPEGRRRGWRDGTNGLRSALPSRERQFDDPAERWEIDFLWAKVWVQDPLGGEPVQPVICLIKDNASRAIPGFACGFGRERKGWRDTGVTAAALFSAMKPDPYTGIGGRPRVLSPDTDNAMLSTELVIRLDAIGTKVTPRVPGEPTLGGLIEAANKFVVYNFAPRFPLWERGPKELINGVLRPRGWPNTDVTLDKFVAEFADWVRTYNTTHPVQESKTALDLWNEGAAAVRPCTTADLTTLLFAEECQVYTKGARFAGTHYQWQGYEDFIGRKVTVRYQAWDYREVEIEAHGAWAGTARPWAKASPEDLEAFYKARARMKRETEGDLSAKDQRTLDRIAHGVPLTAESQEIAARTPVDPDHLDAVTAADRKRALDEEVELAPPRPHPPGRLLPAPERRAA